MLVPMILALQRTLRLAALTAGLAMATAATAAAQDVTFRIFVQGQPLGLETVTVLATDDGWKVMSTGQISAPVSLNTRIAEVAYDREWRPKSLFIDAVVKGKVSTVKTTFTGTTAVSEVVQDERSFQKTDTVDARTIVLSNLIFGTYEALAARVAAAPPGTTLRVYVAPQAEIGVRIGAVSAERVSAPGRTFEAKRHALTFDDPKAPLAVDLWTDGSRLMRLAIPSANLEVIRDDVATVATRTSANYRTNDADVSIPTPMAFYLKGTLSKPAGATDTTRLPAIVLVAGDGPGDRDEPMGGIPVFAQLASALADAGFAVVRYDRRGIGQSGGRIESATIGDYADDAAAAVKLLEKRKDIDKDRIVVVGHGEGAAAALLAIRRSGAIRAGVLLAGPGTRGGDLILEQQQRGFEAAKVPEDERAAKIALQKRVNAAVLTDKNWDGIPDAMRRRAEQPWFASLLTFDPKAVVDKIDQPLLVIHGGADTEIPPHHAEKLAALANTRTKAPKTVVIVLPGVGHALANGQERSISPDVAAKIAAWVNALPAKK
jgi:pimeloyl-ACP methyl ester carboxylesterase